MKYADTLIATKDMTVTGQFCHIIIRSEIAADFSANNTPNGGVVW